MTYRDLLKSGTEALLQEEIPNPRIDAEWLLLDVTGKTRSYLFLHDREECDPDQAERYFQFIKRRQRGEPVQYITGSQEFMGLSFAVGPSVLIPRQDTEILVETALEYASQMDPPVHVLDLCCGSGAIAVSVAYYLPGADITAADISEGALITARRNAEKNGMEERISFLLSDMFSAVIEEVNSAERKEYDLILCNPPYIPTDVIPSLQKEITEYEPVLALDGGQDGLDYYRILAEDAWKFMRDGGVLLMEIGFDQAEEVGLLLKNSGHYCDISVIRDLAGKDRVIRCGKSV